MAFSETIGQENWINNQIETALSEYNTELRDLQKMVVDSNNKVKLKKATEEQEKELKKEYIVNILDKNKNKSRHDIYETGKGAGVTFAVQYALQEM